MFNVGDEVEVIDASPLPSGRVYPLVKGQKFVVLSAFTRGADLGDFTANQDLISIGVEFRPFRDYAHHHGFQALTFDVWQAYRFRKIQRKRAREELYSLIGIDGMVDQREGVAA